jgi:hypothetical protein
LCWINFALQKRRDTLYCMRMAFQQRRCLWVISRVRGWPLPARDVCFCTEIGARLLALSQAVTKRLVSSFYCNASMPGA